MAPRKNANKPLIVDVNPKRNIRKKPLTEKSLTGKKLKRALIAELLTDKPQDPEDVAPKRKRARPGKRQLILDQDTEESVDPELTPKKITKTQATRSNKQNRLNITVVNEVTEKPCQTKEVAPKLKRGNAANKQNQEKLKIIIANEGGTYVTKDHSGNSPESVASKIKKSTAAHKQNQNEIKIMLANEVIRNAFQKKPMVVNKISRPRRRKKTSKPDNNAEAANNEVTKIRNDHENIQDVAKKKILEQNVCCTNRSLSPLLDVPQLPISTTSESPDKQIKKKAKILSLKRQKLKPVNATTSRNKNKEGKKEAQASAPSGNNATLCDSNECITPDSTTKANNLTQTQPSNIVGRKNSGASLNTCFSWTQDISSSSAVTCVTVKSTDYVRIDKRIPIVKLQNVDHKIKSKHLVDNIIEDDSFDNNPEKSKCPSECNSVSISNFNVSQTLNLSTSSLTSVTTKSTRNKDTREPKDETIIKLRRTLENLSSKMQNFDLEIINWIGYQNESNDVNTTNFHSRIFEVFDDENDVIKYCRDIKRVLVGNTPERITQSIDKQPNIEVVETEPKIVHKLINDTLSKDIDEPDHPNADISDKKLESRQGGDKKLIFEEDEMFNENKSCDQSIDDDDDALSLFAESITGLESSRKNSSLGVSAHDKSAQPDINEPLYFNESEYQPSRNAAQSSEPASYRTIKNVKKQTADSSTILNKTNNGNTINERQSNNRSTNFNDQFSNRCNNLDVSIQSQDINAFNRSLFSTASEDNHFNLSQNMNGREFNCTKNWTNKYGDVEFNADRDSVNGAEDITKGNPDVEHFKDSVAYQLAMTNKHLHVVSSNIFKGVCIFNLVGKCKSVICNFPHKSISIEFVSSKLQDMSESTFVKESMFLLKWPVLKRKYGMCFVEECIRRNLTIWLLHLLVDFITKINRNNRAEETFGIQVTEAVLLHLNDADMKQCADILRWKIRPNICMCDHLMYVISKTQNFSRFKNVFIKLTLFICEIGRTFQMDVATQVLERLCILPYDDALARALIKIIQKTTPSIFSISMMGRFEDHLSKNNQILYKELMGLKLQAERCSQNITSPPTQSSRIASSTVGHASAPVARADSPDTTNTDFMNPTAEPVITRTITINRTINTTNLNMTPGSDSSEEPTKRYEPQKTVTTWRRTVPNFMSLRPHRQMFKQPGFAPRAFDGTPKFFRKPPRRPY